MNDPLIEKALELKQELLLIPEVKEFLKNKALLENSKELKEKRKLIVRCKNEGRIDEYHQLLNEYDSHPLVINYQISKENVKEILQEIQNILN